MPTVPNEFKAEGEAREPTGAWVWLVDANLNDSQSIQLTSNNEDVTFNSKTYAAFGVDVGYFQLENQGTIGSSQLVISNAVLDFGDILDRSEGFRDQQITLTLVHTDNLSSPAASIAQTFYVESSTAKGNTALFNVGITSAYRMKTPQDRTSTRRCRWQYKSTECAYTEQSKSVTGATNASPIVLTVVGHNFKSSGTNYVQVSGVGGNTAANGRWPYIVVSADTISLTGSTGNGAYTSGGTAVVNLPTCDRSRLGPNGCHAHDNLLNYGGQDGIPRI